MMHAIVLLAALSLTLPAFAGEAPSTVEDPAPPQIEQIKDTVDEGQVPLDGPSCCDTEGSIEVSVDYYLEQGGYE